MAPVWEEVSTVQAENRRELTLQGSKVNQRIKEYGLDESVFSLKGLNLLKIAGTPISCISEHLGDLTNLNSLMLENNKLQYLPSTIGQLTSLKTLDVSGNCLECLPDTVSELVNLQSLNANLNKLSAFPVISQLKQLAYLSISRNELTSLPEGITSADLVLLSTVDAANNSITALPDNMSNLTHLIKLNVSANKLHLLPLDLCECLKLKELIISDNKMKDRKLLKLAEHSTKSLLSYLNVQLEKQRAAEGDGRDKKGKNKSKKKKGDSKDVEDIERDKMSVIQFEPDSGLTVSVTQAVMSVRQYIVCCIIRNLDFSKSNMFKRFINIQTKLHESVCDKRQAATIATHDLKQIKGPLVCYDAVLPKEIQITPLFKSKITNGQILMKDLRDEAEAYRREKKRSTLSGIHKYLDLLKDKTHYPCLRDSEGDIISFPPITNSDKTKISKETKEILIEVTSSVSLEVCKKVMEETLLATLIIGVGTATVQGPDDGSSTCAKPSEDEGNVADEDATEDKLDTSERSLPQSLTVEQVKIVDGAQGNLRVIYPSRVDLQNPLFDVVRNYE